MCLQELQNDAVRQERLKHNVALLEARDAQTRISAPESEFQRSGMLHEVSERDVSPTRVTTEEAALKNAGISTEQDRSLESNVSPWEAADKPLESHSWTPTVGRGPR
jgi:hypothetical protein